MKIQEWELDLICSQADESTWQSSTMTSFDLDRYQAYILSELLAKKAVLVSYEDLKTVYLVYLKTEFNAEFHVFSDGGTWKLVESFRRFKYDVWAACLQMRVETRVRKPVLQAILKRCGVPVEGVRRKAWYDKDNYRMMNENVYAMHRGEYTPNALTPTAAEVERFERSVANLAVAMTEMLTLETLPVKHVFVNGTYTRSLTIPKGRCVIGYRQNVDHVVTISGDLTVVDVNGPTRYMGLHNTFASKAGVQRTAYAHADSVFTTTHMLKDPNERDIKVIEGELFSGSYSEFKQLQLTNQTQRLAA